MNRLPYPLPLPEDKHMSKAGNRYLRYYIIEATGSVIRHCPEYERFYHKKYAETRTHQHKRALALTSRKFIRLLFGLLDKGQLYSPEKLFYIFTLLHERANCNKFMGIYARIGRTMRAVYWFKATEKGSRFLAAFDCRNRGFRFLRANLFREMETREKLIPDRSPVSSSSAFPGRIPAEGFPWGSLIPPEFSRGCRSHIPFGRPHQDPRRPDWRLAPTLKSSPILLPDPDRR